MIKRTRNTIMLLCAIAASILCAAAADALPARVIREKDTLAWYINGVLIWRFPKDAEHIAVDAAKKFDAMYTKGFLLKDILVKKIEGKWTLMIRDAQLLRADRSYARGAGTQEKHIALTCMSRIYDAAASMHASPLNSENKLKGAHSVESKISWYGGRFIGKKCANGEVLTETLMCAAAKKLPFGTLVRVTLPKTDRSVIVRITDRFSEHRGRAIDISSAAAELLGIKNAGVARARIDVMGKVEKIGGK